MLFLVGSVSFAGKICPCRHTPLTLGCYLICRAPRSCRRGAHQAFGDGGFSRILGATRDQLDLRDQAAVNDWFRANRPDYVFLVAGTVGGIMANSTRPAELRQTIAFDTSKPDGAPRKVLDVSRLHNLGWRHRISLREGLESTYEWFRAHQDTARLTGREPC